MCKVLKETDELHNFVVLDNLQASEANLPFLVDWNYHAPSGYREACSRPAREVISVRSQSGRSGVSQPIKKHRKAGGQGLVLI